MLEPTVTRTSGVSGSQPAWPETISRPDAHVDVLGARHPGDAAGARPTPQVQVGLDQAASADTAGVQDAAFPRSYAHFEINKETQRLSIKIIDAATDEVIRVIPSEEVQRISDELQAMARRDAIGKRQSGDVGSGSVPTASGGVDRYV
jgi:hypothetical protein